MHVRIKGSHGLEALERRRYALQEAITELSLRLESLKGEARGIEHAISIVKGIEKPQVEPDGQIPLNIDIPLHKKQRQPRGSVKEAVLGLIIKNAAIGLRAADVVDLARRDGKEFDRSSVASLLSKLYREGTLSFDRETRRYGPAPRSTPILRTVA